LRPESSKECIVILTNMMEEVAGRLGGLHYGHLGGKDRHRWGDQGKGWLPGGRADAADTRRSSRRCDRLHIALRNLSLGRSRQAASSATFRAANIVLPLY
jgi:hypothetical protein